MTGSLRPPARAGSVLALAVLVLLALQLLAHGALLLARTEWASSLAGLRLLQARAGADAAVIVAQAGGSEAGDSVAVFGATPAVRGTLEGHPFSGRMRRLSREYWLVEGWGRSRGERWGVTTRRLVWVLEPRARIAAARGGVEVGGILLGRDAVAFDPERPAFCAPWWAALDSLVTADVWGHAAGLGSPGAGEPSLGRLGAADLASSLPGLAATWGTPAPATALGRCDPTSPWNWGDPTHPGGPCAEHLVAGSVSGDLVLEGGVGQGVLVVGGNVDLAGARFDGVLLVGGALTLRDGAEVRGMVRVGGDLDVGEGSRILGSPCRALRALEASRGSFRRPVPVSEVGVLEGGA